MLNIEKKFKLYCFFENKVHFARMNTNHVDFEPIYIETSRKSKPV